MGGIEKLDLKSESSCKEFLNKIFLDLIINFELFDFNGLEEKVKKLLGVFFKEIGEVGEYKYKFVYDSIYEVVEVYFCEIYFIEIVKYFVFDLI